MHDIGKLLYSGQSNGSLGSWLEGGGGGGNEFAKYLWLWTNQKLGNGMGQLLVATSWIRIQQAELIRRFKRLKPEISKMHDPTFTI